MSTKDKSNGERRRPRERTTPVGRVHRNLLKAIADLELVVKRLGQWRSYEAPSYLERAFHSASLGLANAIEAAEGVGRLTMADWAPPQKSLAVVYVEGEQVSIVDGRRARYLEIYDGHVVDELVVAKVLPTGQIAVAHGRRGQPFIVSKSHLKKGWTQAPAAPPKNGASKPNVRGLSDGRRASKRAAASERRRRNP